MTNENVNPFIMMRLSSGIEFNFVTLESDLSGQMSVPLELSAVGRELLCCVVAQHKYAENGSQHVVDTKKSYSLAAIAQHRRKV